MSATETAAEQIPPGIYYIVVASHGRFLHERLTERGYPTITPPSAKPDPKQRWQVKKGRQHGTINIQRPGDFRPPLSITYKSAHGHAKEGDKIELRPDEFATDWELDIAPGRSYYIRVPRPHPPHAEAAESVIPGRTLGIAVAPERINPPFLEIDYEEQLQWVFERVPIHALEE